MSDPKYPDSEMDEVNPTHALRRRDFLKTLGGGLIVSVALADADELFQEQGQRRGSQVPTDFNAFLRIGEDGRVTCYTGKIEQGQGIMTALPLMLAEELEVSPSIVDIVLGDTDLCPYDGGTVGSQGVRIFGPLLRAAAVEARTVLIEMAAEKLQVPAERLRAKDGAVYDSTRPETSVTYAQLVQGKKIERRAAQKPALKAPKDFKVMGKSAPRRDARDKATGKAKYAGDIRVPGMLYARILRPPAHGAKLKSLDASGAEAIAGVRVVRDGELVAALHELPDVAEAAVAKIKATYDPSPSELDDKNIYEHLVKNAAPGRAVAQGGDLAEGAKAAATTVERTFLNAYVAHASMETHTAFVDFKDGKATAWVSSQAPFRAKTDIASALGIPPNDVHVIEPYVGGGFGGKSGNPQAVQAAKLARITGKPVQVMRTRADEFFLDTFRPAAVVNIKAGLAADGKIVFWDYEVLFAGERSSQQFYAIPHHRTVVRGDTFGGGGSAGAHPFGTGAWRGPGSNTNIYARESFIDILAARAGIDPVEFRLLNLSDARMQRVVRIAAEKFGWKAAKAPSGRGFGFGCADYLGTYLAAAVEIAVDKKTGHVQVKRMLCAHDSGVAVNPAGTVLQIEGCFTMGLGAALTEEVHFKNGEIKDLNFDTYQIPRFSWLPKIEAVLVDSPEVPISGVGEPAITITQAVLANAVFDACGARLLQLPMTPERILAALPK
jgi:nicotinate dehydrogenase subunit B